MDSIESPPSGSSSAAQAEESSPTRDKPEDDSAAKKPAVRKRTKTGCLTCRKRRIKCDEARPTCANCIKSKRQCEGYNQRVIFKEPLGAFAPFGPLVYPQPSSQALVREQQLSAAQQKSSSQSLQIIAPKPPPPGYYPGLVPQFSPVFPNQIPPVASSPLNYDPNVYGIQPTPIPRFTFFPPETVDAFSQNQWRQGPPPPPPLESQLEFQEFQQDRSQSNPLDTLPFQHQQIQLPVAGLDPDKNYGNQSLFKVQEQQQPNEWVEEDGGEFEYDDEMGESDDDDIIIQRRQSELNSIVSQRLNDRFDSFGIQPRTFAIHANHVMATYEPSPANSPLNDKQIAEVFWHFVNVTGPAISMYERHPFDGTTYFEGPQAKARQHIWTSTFPILSLSHPALLQAILAIGSLQIAKLKLAPPTASLKHYHLSLRRIARNVGRPSKKTQPSNLAAILLLAFYEVWNSDHGKWCKHLLGGRWIIKDIPFPDMGRKVMDIKRRLREKKLQDMQNQQQQILLGVDDGPFSAFGVYDHQFDPQPDPLQGEMDPPYHDWDLMNLPLLSVLTGRNIHPDELGFVPEEHSNYPRSPGKLTAKDIELYETLSDLYWWYCKMDVYQSVLGGTRLFMNYDLWAQCPPRAPMCRSDAIYGTYDHLLLVLGRLSEYQSRDLTRKRRFFKVRGTFGPTGAPPGTFPGMMPASDHVQQPMGFSPPREDPSSPKPDSEEDLDLLTAKAYQDWEGIKAAFEAFRNHLGPEFEPLDQDLHPISMSPFGPAMRYRTYSIAGIWMNYFMGMIILHRSHPQMPPVAMMAAPMSAQQTMGYALQIARIAHGLEENVGVMREVSTLVSAAFIESAFCLFVAGVQVLILTSYKQYQADTQRQWLIRHLHDITRLTGWESGRRIAEGCESAWSRAAGNGRGPPYTRSSDTDVYLDADKRGSGVWSHPRRIDKRIQEIEDEMWVVEKEEKAHYALGLIGVQEDLEKLDLDSAEKEGGYTATQPREEYGRE
ncbi:C6 finger domain-containing protein [Seiridium cupressi]